jgi:hypothetical protein
MARARHCQRGLSLAEVTIMLSVLSVMTAVLSPGPNGLVETDVDADGHRPGGGDIVAVISGGR